MAQNNKNKNKQSKQQNKKTLQETVTTQKRRNLAESGNQEKKCSSCCKWLMGSALLIILIGAALTYDTEVNGKGVFAKSAFGKALDNAGVLPHVQKAWYTTMGASARAYQWAEVHVPPYAKPAGILACDLYKLTRNAALNALDALGNFIKAKMPVVANFLDEYVPGLPKKIENAADVVKTMIVQLWQKSVHFVNTQVLIGRLSPENLSQALNQTQNAAIRYYNMFHKKVDAYAKLK